MSSTFRESLKKNPFSEKKKILFQYALMMKNSYFITIVFKKMNQAKKTYIEDRSYFSKRSFIKWSPNQDKSLSTMKAKVFHFLHSRFPSHLPIMGIIWQFAPFFLEGDGDNTPQPYTIFFSKSLSCFPDEYLPLFLIQDLPEMLPDLYTLQNNRVPFMHTFYIVHSVVSSTSDDGLYKINNLSLNDMGLSDTTNRFLKYYRQGDFVECKPFPGEKKFVVLVSSELFLDKHRYYYIDHHESVDDLNDGKSPRGYIVLELSVFNRLLAKNQLSADVNTIKRFTKSESKDYSTKIGFADNARAIAFFNTWHVIKNLLGIDFTCSRRVDVFEKVLYKNGSVEKRQGLPRHVCDEWYEEKSPGRCVGILGKVIGKRKFDEIQGQCDHI